MRLTLLLFFIAFGFIENSHADFCLKTSFSKDCKYTRTETWYYYQTPVCVMVVACTIICDGKNIGTIPKEHYCNMNFCTPQTVKQCKEDASVINTEDQIDEITKLPRQRTGAGRPISPGPGLDLNRGIKER